MFDRFFVSSKQEEHAESGAGLSGPGPLPALPGALAHAESRSEAGRGTLDPPGYVSAGLVMTVAQGESESRRAASFR